MKNVIKLSMVFIAVTISVLTGIGQMVKPSSLTDLQFENAEALTDIELGPVTILCNNGGQGRCYRFRGYVMDGEAFYRECYFTGVQTDYCWK